MSGAGSWADDRARRHRRVEGLGGLAGEARVLEGGLGLVGGEAHEVGHGHGRGPGGDDVADRGARGQLGVGRRLLGDDRARRHRRVEGLGGLAGEARVLEGGLGLVGGEAHEVGHGHGRGPGGDDVADRGARGQLGVGRRLLGDDRARRHRRVEGLGGLAGEARVLEGGLGLVGGEAHEVGHGHGRGPGGDDVADRGARGQLGVGRRLLADDRARRHRRVEGLGGLAGEARVLEGGLGLVGGEAHEVGHGHGRGPGGDDVADRGARGQLGVGRRLLGDDRARRHRRVEGLGGLAGEARVLEGGLGLVGGEAHEVGHGHGRGPGGDDVADRGARGQLGVGRRLLGDDRARRHRRVEGLGGLAGEARVLEGGLGLVGGEAHEVGHGRRLHGDRDAQPDSRSDLQDDPGCRLLVEDGVRFDVVGLDILDLEDESGVVGLRLGVVKRQALEVRGADGVGLGYRDRDAQQDRRSDLQLGVGRRILVEDGVRFDVVGLDILDLEDEPGVVGLGLGIVERQALEVGRENGAEGLFGRLDARRRARADDR